MKKIKSYEKFTDNVVNEEISLRSGLAALALSAGLAFGSPAKGQTTKINPTEINVSKSDTLKFLGIPVSGDYSNFSTKLKSKGFILTKNEGNVYIYSGVFLGEKSDVVVLVSPKTKQVCKVVVFMEEKESWSSLESKFNDVCELMTKKYGEPKDKYSFFSRPYKNGDGYEITAVKVGKCNYFYGWNDNMVVEISKAASVSISYEGNMSLYKSEKSEIDISQL